MSKTNADESVKSKNNNNNNNNDSKKWDKNEIAAFFRRFQIELNEVIDSILISIQKICSIQQKCQHNDSPQHHRSETEHSPSSGRENNQQIRDINDETTTQTFVSQNSGVSHIQEETISTIPRLQQYYHDLYLMHLNSIHSMKKSKIS